MKLIQIGSDRNVFNEHSKVFKRMLNYAGKVEEMHLIVFSLKKNKYKNFRRKNLYLYSTNSLCKLSYIFSAFSVGKKILKRISDKKNIVISSQDPFEAGLVAYCLKKKFNIKIQIQIHTDFLSPFFKKGILNRVRLLFPKIILSNADGIRVVSKRIKNSILQSKMKLKTLPRILPIISFDEVSKSNKKEKEIFEKIKNKKSLIIATLARLVPEKNLELLIDIFNKLKSEAKEKIILCIAGDGYLKHILKQKIKKLKIDESVFLLGDILNTRSLLNISDIYIQISNYEGFGLSLYEAKIAGLPIITTDVGLVGDIIKNGEGALVCPVGDKRCLYDVLLSIVDDENFRNSLSEQSKLKIESGWLPKNETEYINNYIKLLKDLLK